MASRRPNECALNVVVHCLAAVLFYGCAAAQENVRVPAPDSTRAQTEPVQSFQEFAALYEDWIDETATTTPCTDAVAPVWNELHDCQRLVVFDAARGGRPAFGPLVGIYPDVRTIDSVTNYSTPRLVALVINYGATAQYGGNAVTYASDRYPPLQIVPPTPSAPTTHCLWLRDTGSAWEAAMLPPSGNQSACDRGQAPNPSQWDDLRVRRERYEAAFNDAYPNTARWRWTRAGRLDGGETHFIGIKCADAWCQIGAESFSPDAMQRPTPRWSPSGAIPGYSDAQFLAVEKRNWQPNAGMGGPFEPGPWAEIRPLKVPHGWKWERPFEVAAIEVERANRGVDRYDVKFGLERIGQLRMSRVFLERPPAGQPRGGYVRGFSDTMAPAAGVIPSPTLHGVGGSARWRWHDDVDETVWVSCWAGCCELRAAN